MWIKNWTHTATKTPKDPGSYQPAKEEGVIQEANIDQLEHSCVILKQNTIKIDIIDL